MLMDYQQFKEYRDSGEYSLVKDEYLHELERAKKKHDDNLAFLESLGLVGLLLLAFILRLLGII